MTIILILVPTLLILFLILDNHRLRMKEEKAHQDLEKTRESFRKIVLQSLCLYNMEDLTFSEAIYKERLKNKKKKCSTKETATKKTKK